MNKIHLVMPMGGNGTRFVNEGFDVPKPLIMLQGKPFFYWAVRSVKKFINVEDIIFVVLKKHVDNFYIDRIIKEYFPNSKIQIIPHTLNGAVLTCREGLKNISDNLPILFNDCDHAFICHSFYDFCKAGGFDDIDGALLTFVSNNPNFSYVKFDDSGKVIGTVEKTVVSSEAICGAYYFKNKKIFESTLDLYLKNCSYNEFFISGLYNEMALLNRDIATFQTEEHITFGTPEEYNSAICDGRLDELL